MKMNIKSFVLPLAVLMLTSILSFGQTSRELSITKQVHQVVNNYRVAKGLSPMKALKSLNEIARQHAADMARGRVSFSHKGFDARVNKMRRIYQPRSYNFAENLFTTTHQTTIAQRTLQGWIDSPSHKENLDGDFLYTGIGVVQANNGQYFVTQVYVTMQK